MACTGGTITTAATGGLTCLASAAGDAVSKVGNNVFSSIASYFGSVAASATAWLWTQLNQATSVDITSNGIQNDLVATGAIAATITCGLFLIQVIASAIRQDFSGLGRAVRGIAVAFIGAAFAVAATQILLAAVDALCNGVVQYALGSDLAGMGSKLIAVTALTTISNPAGQLLMALILLIAVVSVWVALMTRKMLIIISAVFAPIAFSGSASDISQSWVKRWIEFTVALVFSKLILVIIFMIGLSVLSGAGTTTTTIGASGSGAAGQGITNLAIGALILLMAGFAPWMAIKMVHFAGDSFHAIHAQAGAATASAQQAAAMPQKIAAPLSKVGGGGGGSKPASGSGSGVPAPQQKPANTTPADQTGASDTGGCAAASAAAAGPAAPGAAAAVAAVSAVKSAANNAAGQAQEAGQSASSNGASAPRPPKSA
jgi:hypothetical protein